MKPSRTLKRSDNAIPDYDYLFNDDPAKTGKKKTRKPLISKASGMWWSQQDSNL